MRFGRDRKQQRWGAETGLAYFAFSRISRAETWAARSVFCFARVKIFSSCWLWDLWRAFTTVVRFLKSDWRDCSMCASW